jgi:hypothetical protein
MKMAVVRHFDGGPDSSLADGITSKRDYSRTGIPLIHLMTRKPFIVPFNVYCRREVDPLLISLGKNSASCPPKFPKLLYSFATVVRSLNEI